MKPNLYIIDAMAIIFRAYFAFINNPRVNSKGLNTSAMFGFTNSLLEIITKQNPTHLVVATDMIGKTKRSEEFLDYKANRQEPPEDLVKSIPYIFKILEGFNIQVIGMEGYEADDIIGTIALKAENEGYNVFIMTSDKDMGQLVTENIKIYRPAYMGNPSAILGIEDICKRYEINNTKQLIDLLGLWGDSSDNIPGIKGIGEKTAIKLIKEFGSMENLFENTHKLSGKLKEKIESGKDLGIISKKLATIITDVPIEVNLEDFIRKEKNENLLNEILNELEFTALTKRIFASQKTKENKTEQPSLFEESEEKVKDEITAQNETSVFKTIKDVPHNYLLIKNEEDIINLCEKLNSVSQFCFDSETTSLDSMTAEIVGLAISYKDNEAYYITFDTNFDKTKKLLSYFIPIFENENIIKVGQNIKYDMGVLKKYGIEIKGNMWDTMLAHYLLEPEMKHNMTLLCRRFLNYNPIPIENLIGDKGKNQKNMRDIEPEKIAEYSGEDADVTLKLKNILDNEMVKNDLKNVFEKIEMPLVPVLLDMEFNGISLDTEFLLNYSKTIQTNLEAVTEKIYTLTGSEFNISSPKQLGEILFDKMKIIDKAKKTATKQFSTSEETLQKLKDKHPVIEEILNYRELTKLKNTYVDVLPTLVSPITKRIHTTFNQTIASTGRLSSINPNLQNIPIKTSLGKEIRKAFISSDNSTLLSADYSQIELRLMAILSEDKNMIKAFNNGEDIHRATAANVYKIPEKEVTSEMRNRAKTVNFGIIYGISPYGLSSRLNIPINEAKDIINKYFESYPNVKNYMNKTINSCREFGYVKTLCGRVRKLPDIYSQNQTIRGFAERNAINSPIQGSAADIIKLAMINLHKEIKNQKLKSKMLLQVHDELLFEVDNTEIEIMKKIVKEQMENAMKFSIPMQVEIGLGKNWLEAH